jgi:hypothetical protein
MALDLGLRLVPIARVWLAQQPRVCIPQGSGHHQKLTIEAATSVGEGECGQDADVGCRRGMASRSGGRAEGRSADIRAVLEYLAPGPGPGRLKKRGRREEEGAAQRRRSGDRYL